MSSAQVSLSLVNNMLRERGFLKPDDELSVGDEACARPITEVVYRLLRANDDLDKTTELKTEQVASVKAQMACYAENLRLAEQSLGMREAALKQCQRELDATNMCLSTEKRRAGKFQRDLSRLEAHTRARQSNYCADLRKRDAIVSKLQLDLRTRTNAALKLSRGSGQTARPVVTMSVNFSSNTVLPGSNDANVTIGNASNELVEAYAEEVRFLQASLQSIIAVIREALAKEGLEVDGKGARDCALSAETVVGELHRLVKGLIAVLLQPGMVDEYELAAKERQIESLEAELEVVRTNWQSALSTMNLWMKYRNERNTETV